MTLFAAKKRLQSCILFLAFLVMPTYFVGQFSFSSSDPSEEYYYQQRKVKGGNFYYWKAIRSAPIIFIGGSQRSGTTLMRALLDVHDSVSCGAEVTKNKQIKTLRIQEKINFC
jgi:hypothetical protein